MKEQKNVIQIYGFFITAIIFNFLPSVLIQTIGLFLAIAVIIAAYVLRGRSEQGSFQHSHMAYMIKSFWISSLFLALGTIAAFFLADHSIIHETVDTIMTGAILSEEQLKEILMNYARSNFLVFSAVLSPGVFYLTYRLIKGIIFAKDRKTIKNLKNWF